MRASGYTYSNQYNALPPAGLVLRHAQSPILEHKLHIMAAKQPHKEHQQSSKSQHEPKKTAPENVIDV